MATFIEGWACRETKNQMKIALNKGEWLDSRTELVR